MPKVTAGNWGRQFNPGMKLKKKKKNSTQVVRLQCPHSNHRSTLSSLCPLQGGGCTKQKTPVLALLKYPVYRCAQIQSHWNHCHLPTALVDTQQHAKSTRTGTHRGSHGAGPGYCRLSSDTLLDKARGGCCRHRDQHVQDRMASHGSSVRQVVSHHLGHFKEVPWKNTLIIR